MRTAVLLAAAGSLCVGITACTGGAAGLSRTDYIGRAGAICRDANDALRKVKGDSSTPAAVAASINEVVSIERAAAQQLRELRPPPTDAHAVSQWLTLVDGSLDELEAAGRAAALGDGSGAAAANVRSGALQQQADAAALQFGVTACAARVAPPTPSTTPAR